MPSSDLYTLKCTHPLTLTHYLKIYKNGLFKEGVSIHMVSAMRSSLEDSDLPGSGGTLNPSTCVAETGISVSLRPA